jgi:hypothetical protein
VKKPLARCTAITGLGWAGQRDILAKRTQNGVDISPAMLARKILSLL